MGHRFEIKRVESLEFDTSVHFTEQDKEAEPFAFLESFREMGWKNYNRGKYEEATRNFNIALGLYPEDVRTLIGRSISRCRNMLFEGALRDAEYVLEKNEFNKDAIYLQALSQYELGHFENALMCYHKGMNKRGKRPMFRDGRYQAEGTIEDCIGRYAGPVLTDMKSTIQKMKVAKELERKQVKSKCSDDNLVQPTLYSCSNIEWNLYCRQQEQLYNVMAEMYLGKLNLDRKWLNKVNDNPGIKSTNKKGTKKIINLLTNIQKDLKKRQEILRERKPYYHMKNRIKEGEKRFENEKKRQDKDKSKVMKKTCERLLNTIKHERYLKNTKKCLELSFVLRRHLERCPRRLLPDKATILEQLCNIVGNVYLDRLKFKPDLSKRQNYHRIFCLLGFDPIYNEQHVDPIIQEADLCFTNYNNVLKQTDYYLQVSKSLIEQTWLLYEESRCYYELQKYEHMIMKAKKSSTIAKQINNTVWVINCLFMQVIGHMREKNKDEALYILSECQEHSHRLNNQAVCLFLDQCKTVMEEREIRDSLLTSNQIVRKREEAIINLIPDKNNKDRMIRLINKMRALPASRRMSVIPGMILQNEVKYHRNLKSIIPNSGGGRFSVHVAGKTTFQEFIQD